MNLISGTYSSNDGKTIKIENGTTILYENTYSLSLTTSNRRSTLTGKIGTDKKNVTLYQINDSTIMSDASVTYTNNGTSVVLLENTIFKLNKTITPDQNSQIERINYFSII